MPSSTTCSRCPSGSIASTNGWLMSMRRPLDLSIRSTSSCTCAVLSIRLVSSCRPLRAMNTRLGSLIQTSSTLGSSRNGCSGPKPETRATSSPTTASTSGTGATTPVRLRSSWSRTTPSAMRRTSARVALRVDALAADQLAHVLVERPRRARRAPRPARSPWGPPSPSWRSSLERKRRPPPNGRGPRQSVENSLPRPARASLRSRWPTVPRGPGVGTGRLTPDG